MLRPVACTSLLLTGILLTGASGCYHMYSQPYGYSGAPAGTTYPGTMQYGAPIQTLTPGQPYTPGMNYQSVPQGTTPTYQNPSGGLQPIPENNAPNYQNQSNPSTSPTTPNPYFPSTYNPPASGMNNPVQATAYNEPAPLHPPTAGLREVRSVQMDYVPDISSLAPIPAAESMKQTPEAAPASALSQSPPIASNPNPAEAVSSSAPDVTPPAEAFAPPVMSAPPARSSDPFAAIPAVPPASTPPSLPADLPAMEATPASAQSLFDVETKKVVTADQSPFGQDAKFQWLRGVVTQDPQTKTWSIIYSDEPNPEDKWSGHLSLAEHPQLSELKEGDVVEIRGQLDNVVHDRQGKPVYVVTSLSKPFVAAR